MNQKGGTPDFILLCETFLNDVNQKFIEIDGYNLATNNRNNSKGDGVAILIKKYINYKLCNELPSNINNESESVFIKVDWKLNSYLHVIGEIYRPPSNNDKVAVERYENLKSKMSWYM